jgi:hemolysin activation/secretion protein
LEQILKGCVRAGESPGDNLKRCAAALTTRLVQDGFVNSRVYVQEQPKPGRIEVVEGRIVEVRVSSSDAVLERGLNRRLRSLQGTVLNLRSLEQTLVQLRTLPRVGQIRGNLGRLGTDPARAVLNLQVESAALPWQGEIGLRNDGNAGSGEWRALGIALKNDWLQRDDTFLVVGELNADQQAELGSTISSISYTLPLAESLKFTGSFGYSRRNLVEATGILRNISSRQFQGYGQLEWTFKESLQDRWTLFAGISGNRNDIYWPRPFPRCKS